MLRESRFGEASHGPGEAFAQKGLSPDAGREMPCALSHRVGNQSGTASGSHQVTHRSMNLHAGQARFPGCPACAYAPWVRLPAFHPGMAALQPSASARVREGEGKEYILQNIDMISS